VTALRGRVELGDEAVLIGRQGDLEIRAEDVAAALGTLHYEVVTRIGERVPRVAAA
jgi:alanine racemase